MKCTFGSIENGKVCLSRKGEIVESCWKDIPEHFSFCTLDAFVVMPNHFHGILKLEKENRQESDQGRNQQFGKPSSKSLSTIVRSFKSAVTKAINDALGVADPSVWQRNYYEHIIRTERELKLVRLYIVANPLLWNHDPDNTDRDQGSMDDGILRQCGFTREDLVLIRDYLEYRKGRHLGR